MPSVHPKAFLGSMPQDVNDIHLIAEGLQLFAAGRLQPQVNRRV
jgi:hypothetical protein